MKKQINPSIKAPFIRGVFYLLLLIALCAIPFALAERNTTKPGKPSLRPVIVGISAAADSVQKHDLSMPAGSPTPTPTCGGPAAWQPGPPQPPARYAFQAALGTDNLLYVAGGQSADATPILYDQVSRYDNTTNTWSNVAPLPVPLGPGHYRRVERQDLRRRRLHRRHQRDQRFAHLRHRHQHLDQRSEHAHQSRGRSGGGSGVVNGKFYVMGGDDFNNGLNTNFIYDIATNTWTTGATLPDSPHQHLWYGLQRA